MDVALEEHAAAEEDVLEKEDDEGGEAGQRPGVAARGERDLAAPARQGDRH